MDESVKPFLRILKIFSWVAVTGFFIVLLVQVNFPDLKYKFKESPNVKFDLRLDLVPSDYHTFLGFISVWKDHPELVKENYTHLREIHLLSSANYYLSSADLHQGKYMPFTEVEVVPENKKIVAEKKASTGFLLFDTDGEAHDTILYLKEEVTMGAFVLQGDSFWVPVRHQVTGVRDSRLRVDLLLRTETFFRPDGHLESYLEVSPKLEMGKLPSDGYERISEFQPMVLAEFNLGLLKVVKDSSGTVFSGNREYRITPRERDFSDFDFDFWNGPEIEFRYFDAPWEKTPN